MKLTGLLKLYNRLFFLRIMRSVIPINPFIDSNNPWNRYPFIYIVRFYSLFAVDSEDFYESSIQFFSHIERLEL